jgi:hypothetical protein
MERKHPREAFRAHVHGRKWGVTARWEDAVGDIIKAENLDELKEAYESYETARIIISGRVGNAPNCTFNYHPSTNEAGVNVEAENASLARELIAAVKAEFPLTIPRSPDWDSLSLTFAGIIYSAVLTVVGVVVSMTENWAWVIVWAILSIALLTLGMTILKSKVIRLSERFLFSKARQPPAQSSQ